MEKLVARPQTALVKGGVSGLGERFLASQDVKASSRHTYERGLRQFALWLSTQEVQNPSRETILAYKRHLQNRGLSPLTLSSYLVVVRKFFEWMEGTKLYPNVARGVKGAKQTRNFRKDPLTAGQVIELLETMDRSTLQGKRDFAVVNLMVRTALRDVEITRANVEDIRQDSGEAVLWIQGKGRDSKDAFVLLTKGTLRPIRAYLRARGKGKDTDPLFCSHSNRNKNGRLTPRSISGIVKKHLRGIGLALQGGATIQEAQALGRHANINTTLIYAHNINRIAQAPERKIDSVLAGAC
jgi:integrase/recombinase XerD